MTLGSHQRVVGKSQTHITPPWLIARLNETVQFDLDPCAAPAPRPYTYARHNCDSGGLELAWFGRVWLNPPFDRYEVAKWVRKLADHGNGIALLHARTEAAWFEPIWESADAILFLADRLKFYGMDGCEQPANSGAPAVLAAWGEENEYALRNPGFDGWLVKQRTQIKQQGGPLALSETEGFKNAYRCDELPYGRPCGREPSGADG